MSRPAILFLIILIVIVGGAVALSFVDTEVQPKAVEKPIANEKLGL